VAWGFPTRRAIAAGSTIANSVAIRMQHGTDYRPPNIASAFPAPESGMQIEKVIPDPPAV